MNFLSSDDLGVNYWDLETTQTTFRILNIEPDDIKDVEEIITCAKFVPQNDYQYFYGTSNGETNMIDLRLNSKRRNPTMIFYDETMN